MKVSGAMAMADNLEAFGMTEGKSNEMIERVALAICGDNNPENILTIHRIRARAAIEAMHVHFSILINAGYPAYAPTIEEINKALKETK